MTTDHSYYQQPLDYEDILYEVDGPMARIILNRPEQMNALRNTLRGELFHALRVAESDPRRVRHRHQGQRPLLQRRLRPRRRDRRRRPARRRPARPGPAQWARHLNAGYFLIWELTKVVIAQAHGYCLAGGSELAAYCDLFVVADDALIGYPPCATCRHPTTAGSRGTCRCARPRR